jgi:GH25 family lysozyme M1 (1,4-beta-N-acetylmuramidase)
MQIKKPTVLDVAYNNRGTNWAAALPAVDAVICKASESIYGRDTEFPSTWPQLGALNLPRGAYHFYRKAWPSAQQARNFVNAIDVQGGLKAGDKLILDVEENGCSITAILDCLYNIEVLTGIRPILYSRAEILNALSFAKLSEAQRDYIKSTPVWTAGYPDVPDAFERPPAAYTPDQARYGKVVLWQYAGDMPHSVPGVLGGLDFNWIDPDFFAEWQSATGVINPPTTGGSMFTGKVTSANGLKIRKSYPSGTQIGLLQNNDLVEADRIEANWWYLTRITRGTVNIPLPGPVGGPCWASGQYILNTTVETPPPPPDEDPKIVVILATYDDGSTQVFEPQAA